MNGPKPPSLTLFLRELSWLPVIAASPFRRAEPAELKFQSESKAPPVLVFPGLLSNDHSTSVLRRTFEASGFPAYGAGLGLVTGVTDRRLEKGLSRLKEIEKQHGQPPIIVGWSLGGIYARVLAQRHPHLAKMVVTLGTPFSGDRRANNAWRIYNALNDHTVDKPTLPDDPSVKPEVHTVAVYSNVDGVIAPDCAWGNQGERDAAHLINVPHMALGAGKRAAKAVVGVVVQELARCSPGE